MMSKKNFVKRGQSLRKNPFVDKTCFQCGELGHIIINCPNKKNDKNKKDKKNDDKKMKKFIKKKKIVKPILLNGTPMLAPMMMMMMMMMTSLQRELPGSPSRRLHHYSTHHIVL